MKIFRIDTGEKRHDGVVICETNQLGEILDTLLRIRKDTPRAIDEVLRLMEEKL